VSLLDKQRELEDAPDSFLQQLLQQGDKQYPAWLVHAVADARADMRQRFQNQEALAQAEQPKIVDKTMAKLGGIPDVDPNQAGGDPSLATGIAGGMAGGGVIRGYFEGDLVGDEDDEEEGVALTAEEMLYEAVPGLIESAGGELARMDALQGADYRDWLKTQPLGADTSPEAFENRVKYGPLPSESTTLADISRAIEPIVDPATQHVLRMAGDPMMRFRRATGANVATQVERQRGEPEEAEVQRRRGILSAILEAGTVNPEYATYLGKALDTNKSIDELPSLEEFTPGHAIQAGFTSTPVTPQERGDTGQETTDEELQELLDALTGDSDVLTASREQIGYHQGLVNRGLGFIGDVETARQWDERHDEVQRREAFEQETVIKNARDIAEQRGTNAEEQQEIYDALMNNFSTQIADLESVRKDRARQQAQREAGMPRRLRAAALRQERTGDQSITTAAKNWQDELETFRTDEDNLMTQLRALTQTQYDEGMEGLEDLQDYRMTTDKNLDQAVLDNIRFSTGQYEEEAFHDDLLQDELLDDRLGILKSALSGAGSIDVANIGARAAAANARLASTSQFKNFASDANNWEAMETMVRDLQQAYDKGSPERQGLEEALQWIGEDTVQSWIHQAKVGGSSTEGLALVGQDVRGAVGGTGGRDERLIPVLEAILNKIPAGDRARFIELITEQSAG